MKKELNILKNTKNNLITQKNNLITALYYTIVIYMEYFRNKTGFITYIIALFSVYITFV
jgi:hypothetical protein